MVWAKNARAAVRRVWENEEPRAADRPVPLAAGAMTEAQRDELDAIDPGWCPPWHDPSRCCSWSESDTAHGEACDGFSADTPGRMHDVARTPRRRSRPGRPHAAMSQPGHQGKVCLHDRVEAALCDFPVDRVDPCGLHPDQHLAGSHLQVREVSKPLCIGAVLSAEGDRFHVAIAVGGRAVSTVRTRASSRGSSAASSSAARRAASFVGRASPRSLRPASVTLV